MLESQANIRPMAPGDVAAVSAIEQRSYPFPWNRTVFGDCLRVGYCCRVVELDGKVCGYAIMSAGAAEAHLLNLCVDPGQRGAGLGRMLLEGVLVDAGILGAQKLFLEVRPSNKPAVSLYQGYGFRSIGRRRGYYPAVSEPDSAASGQSFSDPAREDALVMVYYLDSDRD